MVAFAEQAERADRPALRLDKDAFLELVGDLPGQWSPLGLVMPTDASERTLATIGQRVLAMGKGAQWWIGDWYDHILTHTRLKVRDLVDLTGYPQQTLMNLGSVARAFPISRRRENLPWSYHAEVAAFVPEQQDTLLEECTRRGWTRAELRKAIKGMGTPPDDLKATLPATPSFLDAMDALDDAEAERPNPVADRAFRRMMDDDESEADSSRMPPERREGESREFAAGSTTPPGIISLTSKDGLLDGVGMTRLMDTHSNPQTGKVRRPVMVDGKLYIAVRLTRNLDTNADRALCVPLMSLNAYIDAYGDSPGYVTPISVDIWQEQVTEGTRQPDDYSYLRVYDDPYTGLYVILPERERTFSHVREQAAEWDGDEEDEEEQDCPHCGEADCDRSCTPGILAEATVESHLHTRLASFLSPAMLDRFAPEEDVPFAAYWGAVLTAMANRIEELEAVNQAVSGELAKQLVPELVPASDPAPKASESERLCASCGVKAAEISSKFCEGCDPVLDEDGNVISAIPEAERLFAASSYHGRIMQHVDIDSRLDCVKRCEQVATLKDALTREGLQKRVREAIEAKIRRLEKAT